jgi:uncharacterized protein (TIGR02594 family)
MISPNWLTTARGYIGVAEVPGPRHSATITGWLVKLKAWWRDDETPWCGAFVAHCLQANGLAVPPAWYRAKAWATWGRSLYETELVPGAVLVFERQGGGHVGFYVGETPTAYVVLGGNQGNRVSVSRIPRERCIARRWPAGQSLFGNRIFLADSAVPASASEA